MYLVLVFAFSEGHNDLSEKVQRMETEIMQNQTYYHKSG